MNITQFEAHNVFGLREVKLEPGQITLVEGRNGAGKSGVVDAMLATFSSKGIQGEVVTRGEEKGWTYIKFNDGSSVKATFSKDGKAKRTVLTADQDEKRSPQTYLDELFGASIVNPVQFLNMTTAEKRKVLLSALPIKVSQDELQEWFGRAVPVDTDKHGLEVLADVEKYWYDKRKDANADVKAAKNELEVVEKSIPAEFDAAEWENVDTGSLTAELQDIGRIEAEKRQLVSQSVSLSQSSKEVAATAQTKLAKAESIVSEIERLQQQQDTLRKEYGEMRDTANKHALEASALLERSNGIVVPDKTAIEEKLAAYSQAQRVMQQIENKQRLQTKLAEAEASATALDGQLELARQKPKELLKQADFPVDGLEFTDDDITIDGLSIDSLSDGEKLKLGVAIARASIGPLGFIVIDGAEILDSNNLAVLEAEMRADPDHHYIVTKVTDGELTVKKDDEIETKPVVESKQPSMFDEDN